MRRSVVDNFDQSYTVDARTGCWVWNRATDGKGRGVIRYAGRQISAPVMAWLRANGKAEIKDWPVFPVGVILVNKCGNAECCNPEHNAPGTRSQAWHDKPGRREEAAA